MNRRAMIATAGATTALGAIVMIGIAACESRPPQAVAGAPPGGAYYVGPEPGAYKPVARLVNPYAGNKTVLEEGRRLFNWYNCSGCHGDHGGGGMGPSLRDSTWRYYGDDASVFASIAEGRREGMPAWGTKVPRDQIWKIVTYIKSLRTPDEPDPPR